MLRSSNLVKHKVCAKYYRDQNGALILSNICSFSRPVFVPDGWECVSSERESTVDIVSEPCSNLTLPEDITRRSVRRAKVKCMDYILCNDFPIFSTLTFSPEKVDRSSYLDVYRALSVWLSNLVQRHGFRYVAVPEYHKKGGAIHFHMLSSEAGLKLEYSGHYRNSKKIYNIVNWKWGFSTAQRVTGESAREKCAKYIYKYMGKQMGAKIGGRYYLSGGQLAEPVYLYGDDPAEFMPDVEPKFTRDLDTDGGRFREWSFI